MILISPKTLFHIKDSLVGRTVSVAGHWGILYIKNSTFFQFIMHILILEIGPTELWIALCYTVVHFCFEKCQIILVTTNGNKWCYVVYILNFGNGSINVSVAYLSWHFPMALKHYFFKVKSFAQHEVWNKHFA